MHVCMYTSLSLYMYISISLSLYIYIYTHTHITGAVLPQPVDAAAGLGPQAGAPTVL